MWRNKQYLRNAEQDKSSLQILTVLPEADCENRTN